MILNLMKMRHSEEMIRIIAEQLVNEFPGVKIDNVMDKARRLYAIMKLEKSLEEMQVERINEDLKKISKR